MSRATDRRGFVYVLCFDRHFGHAKHYVGCTTDPRGRLITHAKGQGANIVQKAAASGIGFRLAALGETNMACMRRLERQTKDWHGAADFCCHCTAEPRAIPGTTPQPIYNLPWPIESAGLADLADGSPALDVRFASRADPMSLGDDIRQLMQANKDALGFIPVGGDSGITVSLLAGRVVVAFLDKRLVGYLLFCETDQEVKVQQLVVADAVRGCGIGRRSLDFLKTARPKVPFTCRVREDLHANGFWRACGFDLVGFDTHETSGARLFKYRNPNGKDVSQ